MLQLRLREFIAVVCCVLCCRFLVVLPQLQRFGAAVGQFKLAWTRKGNFNWNRWIVWKWTGITRPPPPPSPPLYHHPTTFNKTTLDALLLWFSPLLNKHLQIPIWCRKCLQLTGNSQEDHRSTSSWNCQKSPSLNTVCFCFCLFE